MPQTLSSGSSVAFLLESTANLYSAMVLQSGMTHSVLEAIARAPRTVSRSSSVSLTQASGVTPAVNRRRFFKATTGIYTSARVTHYIYNVIHNIYIYIYIHTHAWNICASMCIALKHQKPSLPKLKGPSPPAVACARLVPLAKSWAGRVHWPVWCLQNSTKSCRSGRD